MSYSVKKAGVGFKIKLGTNSDLSGEADNFSAYYINDADDTKTDIDESFTEDPNTAGLYKVACTIPTKGDYTIVINNESIGMGNHESPIVIVDATIDDVKEVVDGLVVAVADVASDLDGLSGESLDAIKATLSSIEKSIEDSTDVRIVVEGDETALIVKDGEVTGDTSGATGTVQKVDYDGTNTVVIVTSVVGAFETDETVNDGTTSTTGTIIEILVNAVNSVMEFVNEINSALLDGASGLSALKGYTDDVENMLLGTEFLADGETENPLFGANNADLKALIEANLTQLQSDLDTQTTTITDAVSASETVITDAIEAVKTVVDANETKLSDAGYGLEALKGLMDTLQTTVETGETNLTAILEDSEFGLEAIKDLLVSRFDSVDGKLVEIADSIEDGVNVNTFTVFS